MTNPLPTVSKPVSADPEHLTPNQRAWRRFVQNRAAVAGAVVLALFLIVVLLWPLLPEHRVRLVPTGLTQSAVAISDAQFEPPSRTHWCGTDVHGRDLLARMVYGARLSLLVGLFGAGVSLCIGVAWGATAGYAGGRWDAVMMRFVDVLYSLPSIVFVIVLIATLDGFLKNWSSPLLGVADVRDGPALVRRLLQETSPAVKNLREGMDQELRRALDRAGERLDAGLQKQLVAELNRRLNGPSLYVEERFSSVALRAQTRREARQVESAGDAALLNRHLLEDLFPRELARLDRWYRRAALMIFSPKLGASAQMIYLFIGLGAVSWLTMARIVRGEVLSLRARPFVEASRVLGAGHVRILWRHILPNITGVVIVYLTLTVPSIILYESFLSYLGLGIQPPQASLGSLIAEGAAQINAVRVYWWMIVFPGGLLATVLLALNFVGDGLRDALDPRSRR